MNIILKGIGVFFGIFIFLGILGAMFGSDDTSTPSSETGTDTKTAYTKDGKNFISEERMDENIKYGYAKIGEYKEVQVPLDTVVVGASFSSDEGSHEDDRATAESQPEPSEPEPTPEIPFSQRSVTESSIRDAISIGDGDTVDILETDPNNIRVTLRFAPIVSWSTESFVISTAHDAAEAFKVLFSNPHISNVYYWHDAEFTDVYGNEDASKAIVFEMSRETANKMNWDNFVDEVMYRDYKNLFQVVDYYYLHPAIQKGIQ